VITHFLIQEEPKLTEIPKDSGVAANMTPLVRMSLDEALDKINVLEANTKTLDIQLKQVTEERNQANSVLHAQVRASFLNKARALTQIPETSLHKMGNDELESIVKLAEQIKRPNPKSIMFSADSNRNEGLIDLYGERMKKYGSR
jgi:hypothetical protein